MNYTIKCIKLDLLLLKPYFKSIILVQMVPLLVTVFTNSIFEGLSFAATVLAMTTAYTFSIAEKNSLERMYGFLPVKRHNLVAGRYMTIFLTGFISLIFTVMMQSIILSFKTVAPSLKQALGSLLICAVLFSVYAGVQIPGYYRFGSIKGKIFMFIPTVGFLLFYYIINLVSGNAAGSNLSFLQNTAIVVPGALGLIALIILISQLISLKIVENGIK